MKEKNHSTLKDALGKLPGYKAPDGLWEDIEEALASSTHKKGGSFRLSYIWSSAAAVLLILFIGWWFWQKPLLPEVEAEKSLDRQLEIEDVRKTYVNDSNEDGLLVDSLVRQP